MATINELPAPIHGAGIARFVPALPWGVSNKPMVPTALTASACTPLHPLRQHIGQPLGRLAAGNAPRGGVDHRRLVAGSDERGVAVNRRWGTRG